MAEHEQVVVAVIPLCDLCKFMDRIDRPAYADARLPHGQWANVCEEHFATYGCSLGLGRGQRLILRGEP